MKKRTGWKIYFWFMGSLLVLALIFGPEMRSLNLIEFFRKGISGTLVLGVFCYAYREKFLNLTFWKAFFVIAVVDESWRVVEFFKGNGVEIGDFISFSILGIATIVPAFIAVFRYAYKTEDMSDEPQGSPDDRLDEKLLEERSPAPINFSNETVVELFLNYLQKNGHPDIKINGIPEKEKGYGYKKKDIDAIAGPFAIEHTRVDTVENRTGDSANFLKVVGNLGSEMFPFLSYHLSIVFPYHGIRPRQKWNEIREAMKDWILKSSNALPDGNHVINNIEGIPFEFSVDKSSDRRAGLRFSRRPPSTDDFSRPLRNQLKGKADKLAPYKKRGFETILLVESYDIALMDYGKMLKGLQKAFSHKLPEGIDQVWYADVSITREVMFHNFTGKFHKKITGLGGRGGMNRGKN